jgi:CubicO group peptidase (beta-lactamase class C family)
MARHYATWTRREILQGATSCALFSLSSAPSEPLPDAQNIQAILEPIRQANDLPALAAVGLKDGMVIAKGAVGVRKYGAPTPVTMQDKFHLGSCTKALTAHLCAALLERKKLHRETRLEKALPDMATLMHPAYRSITLDHLLCHRSGFPTESWIKGRDFQETRRFRGNPAQQREIFLRAILQEAPDAEPGTKYIYSNRNYSVAGVLAERAMNEPWESLLQQRVFTPLKIRSAGYGAMGTPGVIDQPWQHFMNGAERIIYAPGPNSDNPAAIAPGGVVHMALEDWAKFAQDHLSGLRGEGGILKAESYKYLHTPLFKGDYAGGWIATERGWGGGKVYTHSGSNTQNFAVIWMAPLKNFAVLVATNQGGDAAASATDKVAAAIIQNFLN